MKVKNNLDYITMLNVIATISVVILHTNGCFWTFSKERYWITANIIESVLYFAVPVFFMITGATLINYQERYTTKEFFIKRMKKVIIPFFIWSIIGMAYYYIAMTDKNIFDETMHNIINNIINTKYISIYWFFPAMICTYLAIPLFASVEKEKKKETFIYLIIIGIVFNSLIPFLNNVFDLGYELPIKVVSVSAYMIYPLIGYVISNYDIKEKNRKIIYIVGIIGLLLHIFGTWYLSYESGYIVKMYKGYPNIPCLIYSVAIFTFFKYNSNKILKNDKIKNIVSKLNNYTFAIYLEHFYVMEILKKIFEFNVKSIYYRLLIPFVIIFICCMITAILRKVKYLKNIVPE